LCVAVVGKYVGKYVGGIEGCSGASGINSGSIVGIPVYRAEVARDRNSKTVSRDIETIDSSTKIVPSEATFKVAEERVSFIAGSFRRSVPSPSIDPKSRIAYRRTSKREGYLSRILIYLRKIVIYDRLIGRWTAK
jgi:hypothetical protein